MAVVAAAALAVFRAIGAGTASAATPTGGSIACVSGDASDSITEQDFSVDPAIPGEASLA